MDFESDSSSLARPLIDESGHLSLQKEQYCTGGLTTHYDVTINLISIKVGVSAPFAQQQSVVSTPIVNRKCRA